MSKYFPKQKPLVGNLKTELDLPNYLTIADLKNVTGVDTSKFNQKFDLAT